MLLLSTEALWSVLSPYTSYPFYKIPLPIELICTLEFDEVLSTIWLKKMLINHIKSTAIDYGYNKYIYIPWWAICIPSYDD